MLCVRDREAVKQYGIDELANKGFCIEGGSIFSTLQDLIAHYMEDEDGLPCKLALACPGKTKLKYPSKYMMFLFIRRLPFSYKLIFLVIHCGLQLSLHEFHQR